MSWGSRLGEWAAGRLSPFGRPGTHQETQVTEQDYSYIDPDDFEESSDKFSDHHGADRDHETRHHHSDAMSRSHDGASKDSDVVNFRYQKSSYKVHFPAYAIDNGTVRVSDLRGAAARCLEIEDRRRIRMFYKGRNMKTNDALAREEGMRSGPTVSEILCVVGEPLDSDVNANSDSTGDEVGESDGSEGKGEVKKKRKKRSRKKRAEKTSDDRSSRTQSRAEFLPVPTGSHPLHQEGHSSRQPSPAAPQTPKEKLLAIEEHFEAQIVPQCEAFVKNPPKEKEKRTFEHKKLEETIMGQVLLKLDGVEAEGDEDARAKRKELVKYVQRWQSRLDEAASS